MYTQEIKVQYTSNTGVQGTIVQYIVLVQDTHMYVHCEVHRTSTRNRYLLIKQILVKYTVQVQDTQVYLVWYLMNS